MTPAELVRLSPPPCNLPMRKLRQKRRKALSLCFPLLCFSAIFLATPSVNAFSCPSLSIKKNQSVLPISLLDRRPTISSQLHLSQRADNGESSKQHVLQTTILKQSRRMLSIIHSSPWLQMITVFVFYIFHLICLTQRQLVFPIQWWASPQKEWRAYRHFVGIGYDSLAGIFTLLLYYKRYRSQAHQPAPPPILVPRTMPWKFPPAPSSQSNSTATSNLIDAIRSQYSWPHVVHRATFLLTTICLVTAYFATGRFSLYWQDILYELSAKGWPITTPQFRAWSVLLGHLSWAAVGSGLLYLIPFAPRFFRRPCEADQPTNKPWHWFRFQFNKPRNGKSVWVWWYVSILWLEFFICI